MFFHATPFFSRFTNIDATRHDKEKTVKTELISIKINTYRLKNDLTHQQLNFFSPLAPSEFFVTRLMIE